MYSILYSCGFIERNENDGKTFSNRKSTYQRYQDSYLDSVRLRYAIANRKVTSWRIGRCDVDYAAALRYLNKALEYRDEREKKEKEMLLKYMDKLPENWQVDLTLWRKEHGYHALTEARAKKWAL